MIRIRLAVCLVMLVAGCAPAPAPPDPVRPSLPPSRPVPVPVVVDDRAGRSRPVADPIYPRRGNPALDVLHYGLDLAWEPTTEILYGTATLRIRPIVDAAEMVLDFMPYELESVTVNGRPAAGAVAGEKLTVVAGVRADKPVTLAVKYRGRPATTSMPSHRSDAEPLGLTVARDGSLWTMQEPYGAFTWYPANDQPSDEALYDIAVTVPPGWSGIASGTPAGRDGTTFRYRSTDPVATYLTTLAVGPYATISDTGPRGLPLTYWYRPGRDDRLVDSLRQSPRLLAWLEERFGPYPFPTAGAVIVDSGSAMETQQLVTMGGLVGGSGFATDLFHEYAHQWFGNSVTPTTWRDLWLNEGWATYAQELYEQGLHGYSDEEMETQLRERDAALREALGPPGSPRPENFAESNVYHCPAAMLKELNDALGDTRFFALARNWVQTQRNTQQDRASFTAFVIDQTGTDFTGLIDAWLDSPTTPS